MQANPVNILLVDDESRNLDVLESILESPDYRLVRAQSADEALRALVSENFALLVLDVRMPGMSGLELAQLIKQRKKTQHLPIIFLTAYYQEDEHVMQGYGAGAADYLSKPINPAILRSKVAAFVDLFRKSRALEAEIEVRRAAEQQVRELNDQLALRVGELASANVLPLPASVPPTLTITGLAVGSEPLTASMGPWTTSTWKRRRAFSTTTGLISMPMAW